MAETERPLYGAEDLRQIQRVNEEIARLARLAARPGQERPLFAALTAAVEDERERSRGGVAEASLVVELVAGGVDDGHS